MAIYYVDPYINASVGGIQGTNIPSARTGTWADPFKLTDIANNSSSITQLNGITINNGDEIRFKGLSSIDSFVYGTIRTTAVNYATRTVPDSADQTTLANWRAALNTGTSSTNRGMYFVSDTNHTWLYDNLAGTDIPKGLLMAQTNSTSTSNAIQSYSSTSFPLGAVFMAHQATSLYLKLIDPIYHVKIPSYSYFLNINANVTYSAGWTADGVQDGQTILPVLLSSVTTSAIGISNTAGANIYNLGRFHYCRGCYTADYQNVTTYNFNNAAANTTHYFGTLSNISYTNWSYFWWNNMSNKSLTKLKVGSFVDHYVSLQAYSNGTTNNSTITFGNYCSGISPSVYYDASTPYYFGNIFLYTQYSSSSMLYTATSLSTSVVNFLNNSYLFGYNNTPSLYYNYQGTTVFPANLYNYESAQFLSVMPSPATSNSGPIYGGGALHYAISTLPSKIKLNPAVWYQKYPFYPFAGSLVTANGFGQLNHDMGVLDTEGVDYKNSDSKTIINTGASVSSTNWNDSNYTFGSNTYDGKVISTSLPGTSWSTIRTPLLVYNDDNNNLVIQCNANSAQNTTHLKKISLGYPAITGLSNINISLDISLNTYFTSQAPSVILMYTNNVGNNVTTSLTSTYNAGTLTWSFTIAVPTSNVLVGSCHMGLSVGVYNIGGYANKYTVKNVQVNVT